MSAGRSSQAGLALDVALAQSGDRRALDRLLREHQDALFRHARLILGNEEDALDVMQASMMLVARRLSTLHDPRWFRPWAYRIVTREAVRAAKKRGRERLVLDEGVSPEEMDMPAPAMDERIAWTAEAIEHLPAAARVVARLHYQEGMTLIEIAEALETPLGTVKSRLAYALARLREAVAADLKPC